MNILSTNDEDVDMKEKSLWYSYLWQQMVLSLSFDLTSIRCPYNNKTMSTVLKQVCCCPRLRFSYFYVFFIIMVANKFKFMTQNMTVKFKFTI